MTLRSQISVRLTAQLSMRFNLNQSGGPLLLKQTNKQTYIKHYTWLMSTSNCSTLRETDVIDQLVSKWMNSGCCSRFLDFTSMFINWVGVVLRVKSGSLGSWLAVRVSSANLVTNSWLRRLQVGTTVCLRNGKMDNDWVRFASKFEIGASFHWVPIIVQ
jgi:hypothetical protein